MPRAKPLDHYPFAEYGALFKKVADTRKPLTLTMERKRALSVQSELYAFRRVALANPGGAIRLGIPLEAFPEVRMSIVPDGLQLFHKSAAPGVAEIVALLGHIPTPDPIGSGLVPVALREVEPAPLVRQEELDEAISRLFAVKPE
jgi:hypothetical protein